MKQTEQLYDALTDVDEALVEEASAESAEPVRKTRSRRWRWAAAVAALLAVALLVGILLRPERNIDGFAAYALELPEYPKMATMPTDHNDNAAFDAWNASLLQQKSYLKEYHKEDLRAFLTALTPALFANGAGENRACSPLSLYLALGMLAETADGGTRAQLQSLLGVEDLEALRSRVHALWNANYCDDGHRNCLLATALWLNEGTEYREKVLKTLAESYYTASFRGQMGSEDYNKLLRDWLNEQTGGLLGEQTKDLAMTPETVLALASTVRFQAKWAYPFSSESVRSGIFHSPAGDCSADFLQRKGDSHYYWGQHFGAVCLDFDSGGCMWFLLPDEGFSPEDLLSEPETLDFLLTGYEWENQKFLTVNFAAPKFDVSSRLELSGTLKALGVTDVFDPASADFSPLCKNSDGIFVSNVEHDARVLIDEEGCSAAALTWTMLCGAAPAPDETVDFILDRPFVFAVTGEDGLPLFLGTVNTP